MFGYDRAQQRERGDFIDANRNGLADQPPGSIEYHNSIAMRATGELQQIPVGCAVRFERARRTRRVRKE